jgi:glucose-1-phosphate thymidylyltransferase
MSWKGLLLAGGTGSRLEPLTKAVNKHLLPIYDKPMIYYPLTTLMLGGIKDVVVVSSPDALPQLEKCLGDGAAWGMRFEYVEQAEPRGIADAFIVAEEQLAGHSVALILGDNIFHGSGLRLLVQDAMRDHSGAQIFGYGVTDPSAFGVVEIDGAGRPVSLEEKPTDSRSNLAVPGLYFYDEKVCEIAKALTPSDRGELEITDVNRAYMSKSELSVTEMGRGIAWLDGGTPESMFDAAQYVHVMQARTGIRIAVPEELAFRLGFIDDAQFASLTANGPKTSYERYLAGLI